MKNLIKKIVDRFNSENLSEGARLEIQKEIQKIISDNVAAEKAIWAEQRSKDYQKDFNKKVNEVVLAAESWKKNVMAKVEKAAVELNEEIDSKLSKEVKSFKGNLVEKVSDFLEYKLDSKIDKQKLGDAAKIAVSYP